MISRLSALSNFWGNREPREVVLCCADVLFAAGNWKTGTQLRRLSAANTQIGETFGLHSRLRSQSQSQITWML